ncbi:hypothetical protein Ade02nite_27970 [Paractinoplanes deccanensis]|uniref:Radical SAM core domain-containing protein n=1 Tax=Paractinoplanes deccanensis TaxID=113561 RepID=A0ABQ3Y2D3_9ACTN|nr:radical SAM protein [Actinoplanes deccanensis]GID74156.1 hypothetical protein Ade02nite_27970 [Actinoplanes deccanensis]
MSAEATPAEGPPAELAPLRLDGESIVGAGGVFRPERFGGLAYSRECDRFYAMDTKSFRAMRSFTQPTCPAPAGHGESSFVGEFAQRPIPDRPMVVNCLVTAYCPLRCRYCHADDLMGPFRAGESDDDLDRIVRTAELVPAMVAVITGGDPIVRPDRAIHVIERLAESKALVLDTSGAGDIGPLLPAMKAHNVHLRVSLDAASASPNDEVRPIDRRHLPLGTSSHAQALETIRRARRADVRTTVQTVVTSRNEHEAELLRLHDLLVDLGVRHWALHVMVNAGRGAQPRSRRLRPSGESLARLPATVDRLRLEGSPVHVRITRTDQQPNAVILVNNRGDLYAERGGAMGKVKIGSAESSASEIEKAFRATIDLAAHADRYLMRRPATLGRHGDRAAQE